MKRFGPIQRLTALALVPIALVTFGACGSEDDGGAIDAPSSSPTGNDTATTAGTAAGGNTVAIKTFAFNPNPSKVKVGDEVTWTNEDDILHTVTAGTRAAKTNEFDSELDGKGKTFSHTFDKAGTFDYHCERHPGMDAQVVVE